MKEKKRLNLKTKNAISGFLFFLPWLIGFLCLTLYPTIYSIRLSFHSVLLNSEGIQMDFKGLYYFDQVWNVNTTFRTNLASSMMMICCFTPVIVVFSLIIALLLSGKFRGRTFFRVLFFFPVIIMSGPTISQLLMGHSLSFSEESPTLFQFIQIMPDFIRTPTLFVLNNLVLILWMSGVQILIFLAGLQKISPDLYEAAEIDGAGAWEKFWKITFPFLLPMIVLNAIYTVVDVSNYENNAVNKQITAELLNTKGIYSFSAAISWIYFLCVMAILLAILLVSLFFERRKKR